MQPVSIKPTTVQHVMYHTCLPALDSLVDPVTNESSHFIQSVLRILTCLPGTIHLIKFWAEFINTSQLLISHQSNN